VTEAPSWNPCRPSHIVGLTPVLLQGGAGRGHGVIGAAAAKDEDRGTKLHEAHVSRHEGYHRNLRWNRDVCLFALVGHLQHLPLSAGSPCGAEKSIFAYGGGTACKVILSWTTRLGAAHDPALVPSFG
jgi:hypothetical protein